MEGIVCGSLTSSSAVEHHGCALPTTHHAVPTTASWREDSKHRTPNLQSQHHAVMMMTMTMMNWMNCQLLAFQWLMTGQT